MLQGPGEQQGDLALCFPEHGMHLLFDQTQQRLRLVEVHDTTRLQVRSRSGAHGGVAWNRMERWAVMGWTAGVLAWDSVLHESGPVVRTV